MDFLVKGGAKVAALFTMLAEATAGVDSAEAALADADHTLAAAGVAFMAGLVRAGALATPGVGDTKVTFYLLDKHGAKKALGPYLEANYGIKGGSKSNALAACRVGYAASLAGVRGMATAKTPTQGARVLSNVGVSGTRALRESAMTRALHDFVAGSDHTPERLTAMVKDAGRPDPDRKKRTPAEVWNDKCAALQAHWLDHRGAIVGTADQNRDATLETSLGTLDYLSIDLRAVLAGDVDVDWFEGDDDTMEEAV